MKSSNLQAVVERYNGFLTVTRDPKRPQSADHAARGRVSVIRGSGDAFRDSLSYQTFVGIEDCSRRLN